MSLVEYDLPIECPVIRCEKGAILLNHQEAHIMKRASLIMTCPDCNGEGKLPDLQLEKEST